MLARQLMLLAGLRGLEDTVEKEIRKVPVFFDIMDNKVLGREYKRGIQEGRAEGIQAGELNIIREMALVRFGQVPDSFEDSLSRKSPEELVTIGRRLLTARSVDELLN